MPTEREYSQHVYEQARIELHKRARLPKTSPWRSNCVAAEAPLIDVTKKVRTEKVCNEKFHGICEVLSARVVRERDLEAAIDAYVDAFEKDEAEAAKIEAQVRSRREEIVAGTIEQETEATKAVLEILEAAGPYLDEIAHERYVRSAFRDRNPAGLTARQRTPRRPGGQLLDQLVEVIRGLDVPEVYFLNGPNYKLWQSGEPCVDVMGEEVPAGTPSRKIRRTYAGARDVPVGLAGVENARGYL